MVVTSGLYLIWVGLSLIWVGLLLGSQLIPWGRAAKTCCATPCTVVVGDRQVRLGQMGVGENPGVGKMRIGWGLPNPWELSG